MTNKFSFLFLFNDLKFFKKLFSVPELPEVEVVKNFLKSNFQKKKIIKVKIINKNLRFEIQSIIKKKLTNLIITKIYRRGKYLILLLENNFNLMIHLGMTGYFRMTNEDNEKAFTI